MTERYTRRHRLLPALAIALALAMCLVSPLARAEDPLRFAVTWEQLGLVLQQASSSPLVRESPVAQDATAGAAATPQLWLGADPRVSLVARDWGVSQVLWGHLTVTDQLRLSRSSRMGVGRVRLAGGRISPFVQVGVGQWRIDTHVVALQPTDAELAGQVGGGIELEVLPRAVLALQGDCTLLFPEGREPQPLAAGHLWSALLAARARF